MFQTVLGVCILLIIVIKSIVIVPQGYGYVITSMGKFKRVMYSGINFRLIFIESFYQLVDLREQSININSHSVITKDGHRLLLKSSVYYNVIDCEEFVFRVKDPVNALTIVCMSSMRDVIGSMSADEVISNKSMVNQNLYQYIDSVTSDWGVKFNRVEIVSLGTQTHEIWVDKETPHGNIPSIVLEKQGIMR